VPSNFNRLLIAWASSLIFVIGGVLLLEATYSPDNAEEHDPAIAESDAHGTEAHDGNPENLAVATGSHTPATPTGETNLPAPGQAQTQNTAPSTDEAASVQAIPQSIPVTALADLLEESNFGPLPTIAKDGRKPSDVYAAPPLLDRTRGRIAILMTDLGKKARNTTRAVDELPANVSLAFSVYGNNLHDWGQKARSKGHEVFLSVPMEPVNYPQNDPGPLTLLTGQSTRGKVNLLRSSLGKFSGYVGVVNFMGSRFTAASDSIRPVLDELKRRGLMFVDNRDSKYSLAASMAQGINMPWAVNNGYIDDALDAKSIAAQLTELEKRARAQGTALGIARAYPVTVRAIKVWEATLEERRFILVPVTSIASQQALPR
jgi:uncharacterized protein